MTSMGHSAVVVFFVLSGYLVGGSALSSFKRGWKWAPYLTNRLTRLFVVLLPAIVFGAVLDTVGTHFLSGHALYQGWGQETVQGPVSSRLTLPIALGNLAFLQTILVPTFGSNGPLWSLANELWYYMLFPLLLLAGYRNTSQIYRAGCLCLLGVILWSIGFPIAVEFPIWMIGAAIASRPTTLRIPNRIRRIGMAASILCMFAVAMFQHAIPANSVVVDYLLAVPCGVLIWIAHHRVHDGAESSWSHVVGWVASMSYTLYLTHLPAMVLLTALIVPGIRWTPDALHLLIGLCACSVIFAYSTMLYWFFEYRTDAVRVLIKRLTSRNPVRSEIVSS